MFFDINPDKHEEQKRTRFYKYEDDAAYRFERIYKYSFGWWLVHNLIAHVLIGLFPFKPFFQFHDWTSRRMKAYILTPGGEWRDWRKEKAREKMKR